MSNELRGCRVALVSGGSSGIGLAAVRALRAVGMRVAFFGSSRVKVELALSQLATQPGPDVYGGPVDIRDDAALSAFHAEAEAKLGAVSILVCSAGISPKRNGKRIPLHETGRSEWDAVMSVNASGAFGCVRVCLPSMISQGYGRIVLIGSIAARATPKVAGTAYVASKAALSGLMRSVVSEYSHHGVTCNIVSPGNIDTAMLASVVEREHEEMVSRIPVRRLGTAGEVADVAEFLCRRSSGFINGAVVDVNGGEFVSI